MKSLLFGILILLNLNYFGQDTCRYTLRFATNASKLSSAQTQSLDSLIRTMNGYSGYSRFYIQGHTDNVGKRGYNVRLSERRCRSVKKFLQTQGVSEKQISFEKFGFDVPVADNETETGRADNRRTMLVIVTKVPAPDWHITAQNFKVPWKEKTILTTKNGCKLTIPEDAFELPELNLASGKIDIEIVEYNNPAYFIASGIPMSYSVSGKLFMYHSEEMISIKAFKNSVPVELKSHVKITLNCRKVDSLYETGFYKFNLQEQKWFEDDPAAEHYEAEVQKGETKHTTEEIPKPKHLEESYDIVTQKKANSTEDIKAKDILKAEGNPDPKSTENSNQEEGKELSPEPEPAYLDKIKKAKIDTGGYYDSAPRKTEEDSLAYPCPPDCCDASFFVVLGKRLSENPLDLEGLDLSHKYLRNGKADPEHLRKYNENSLERLGPKKYYHIRLVTKKLFLRKKAIVQFKYDKEKNPELKALKKLKWTFRFKDNTEDYTSFEKRRFNDVRIVFDSTGKNALVKLEAGDKITQVKLKARDPENEIQEKIKHYQKILTPRVLSIYSCFWAFHKKYFAYVEKRMSFPAFINYFNTHLKDLQQRYDSLSKNFPKVIQELHCHCGQAITTCSFIPGGGDDTLVKRLIKQAGTNRMLLIGFGLYNYDKVIPMENLVRINNPEFFNTNGGRIQPKESFLILGGINGMIHLNDPLSIPLIAHYQNTLFIVDKANRRYKLILEANEDFRGHSNKFILQDITVTTDKLEGLERELSIR